MSLQDAFEIAHLHRGEVIKERSLGLMHIQFKDVKSRIKAYEDVMPVEFESDEFHVNHNPKPINKEDAYARATQTGARLKIIRKE